MASPLMALLPGQKVGGEGTGSFSPEAGAGGQQWPGLPAGVEVAQGSAVTKGQGSDPWGCLHQPHSRVRALLGLRVSSFLEVQEPPLEVGESRRTGGCGPRRGPSVPGRGLPAQPIMVPHH